MAPPSEQPPCDIAEDFWLAWHDAWLQPLEWLTAWWDACVVPASGHRALHAPKVVSGRRLTVPDTIAHDTGQHLFA
jgi:hypothetical protein